MSEDQNKEMQVIGSAAQLFMKLGIKSLTMDDVSRQLGISKKTLYKYASNKNELVLKAVKMAITHEQCVLCELSDQKGNSIDKVLRINEMISAKLQEIQPAVIFDMQKYYPEAWSIMEEHKTVFIFNQIKENLKEGIEEGLYRDNMNVELVAKIYVSLIDAIFDSRLFDTQPHTFMEMHKEVARYHLRAISSPKGIEYVQSLFKNKNDVL